MDTAPVTGIALRVSLKTDTEGNRLLSRELALFCTIGIGLERWNDGTLEWWGIPTVGNWVRFARLALANWVCSHNRPAQVQAAGRRPF